VAADVPKALTAGSLLITLVGAALIFVVPFTLWTYARDRRDLARAGELVAKVPAGTAREPAIGFTVPTDPQWSHLVSRLGHPTFLLVVDAEPGAEHSLSSPVTNEGILVQGTNNDEPLIVTATGLRPFGYPSTHQSAAFKFEAASGTVVRVSVRGTSAPIPEDAFLMVFPLWNGLELWHWGDSLSMGEGMFVFFAAPLLILVGAALIYAGGLVKGVV
jgi:hypothetical protein